MARLPTDGRKFEFSDDAIELLPFAQTASTPRYYDTKQDGLLLRVSKTRKQFYVTFHDPVTRKPGQEYVATWGEIVEAVSQRGVKRLIPITTEIVRERAQAIRVRIRSIILNNQSPQLEKMRQAEADKAELSKGMTLHQAWDIYLSKKQLTEPSREDIRQIFAHVSDVLDSPLKAFCTSDWVEERFITIYQRRSQFAHGGSPSVAFRFLDWLKAILNVVDDEGTLLGKNPAAVAGRRVTRGLSSYPRLEPSTSIVPHADRFYIHHRLSVLEAKEDFLASDFIKVVMYTGLRDGAARMLRWDDIRFDRGFCWVFRDTRLDRKIILPLSARAVSVLRERKSRLEQHVDWSAIAQAGWVFPTKIDGQWRFLQESKKFYERLDIPTNTRMVVRDKWRRAIKDSFTGLDVPLVHPDTGAPIYKRASPHDFRRVMASYSNKRLKIALDYVAGMLTHSKNMHGVTVRYITSEDEEDQIKELRECFDLLAEFIDAERCIPSDRKRELLSGVRLTVSSLPGGRAEPGPLTKRSKHTPKTRPNYRTSSRP